MKAYLIDPASQSATTIHLRSGLDEIRQLIGFDTVDSDELNPTGDRLFLTKSASSVTNQVLVALNSPPKPL
ncbi:MAG: hypothetical protein EBQ78_06265 [Betaproteobacteria bacterium]|nr:hypothetical protein [Betaproteobacteria bacterium]